MDIRIAPEELMEHSKNIVKETAKIRELIAQIENAVESLSDWQSANKDIWEMYNVLVYLKQVIFKFMDKYKDRKQLKNIIDFNDIEHYALQILVKKDEETGEHLPTEAAKSYRNKFEEIAIDEYQDSNSVQEYILSTISNGHNMFMVGDVKQSIYRFRQARPELFLEKYNRFKLKG